MRRESDIFSDLSALCRSDGYVHAIAYLCFRDNVIRYAGTMRAKDMASMFSADRLIRTEITTLIGLMIQGDMDWAMPSPAILQEYLDRSEALLKELHDSFLPSPESMFSPDGDSYAVDVKPFQSGELMRELIFYGGESAYNFQYRDFSPQKYAADTPWFETHKGFTPLQARDIAYSLARLQEQKLSDTVAHMQRSHPANWTMVHGYTFTVREIANACLLPTETVEAVLNAFSIAPGEKNEQFHAVDDFNVVNSTPLLRTNDSYVLFQSYSIVEALYESPFYWMIGEKSYATTAMQNRGRFTEEFCRDRLACVFGKERVHLNLDIFESKANKVGEIDVLVLFGDRAVVVQAKSKRLTIEARKGNDGRIRDDFKKSVQDAYEQGLSCAKKIADPRFAIVNPSGKKVDVPRRLTEIYILCTVSDHYPALHFQARQFLKYERTDVIQPPLVLDVFALDAITEMLPTPLRFLSYVNRRAAYTEKLMAGHETVILSYHLKKNLWVKSDLEMLMLSDDVSADLDVAMLVRRDGVTGERIPDGVLTRLGSTVLGRLVTAIEGHPDPSVIDFGFLLLSLSESAIVDVSEGIRRISQLAQLDGRTHDITLGISSANSGFTVHCSAEPLGVCERLLRDHCERRKYGLRAKTWFGICIHPSDESLRFGLKLDYEWQLDARLEALTRNAPRPSSLSQAIGLIGKRQKTGRNDLCHCGSGRKYKKCHGA